MVNVENGGTSGKVIIAVLCSFLEEFAKTPILYL